MKPQQINKGETPGKEHVGKSGGITYKRHQEERESKADEEENSIRKSADRGFRVGAVGQWRHQQAYGKTRSQSENLGTCERAPETDPHQQRRAQRKENRRDTRHWTVEHLEKTLQASPEGKSAPQKDSRRNREQVYGKRTQSENSGTCARAPEIDPHQQKRPQRKENRKETRHWRVEHLQKSLQAPPEEKSAPQRDSIKNRECLRLRTADIRQKNHPRPADNHRDRGTHSVGRRMDEYGWRGAAQCWQKESRCQRRDAPQTPSHDGGCVSERGMRGYPAQSAPARTERNEQTMRIPHWWQHDDRSGEPDERETGARHWNKKWRNANRKWKSERRTNASY
ncbi:hypothetical protein MHYP_G00080950 [Metynnis hypsauchen]